MIYFIEAEGTGMVKIGYAKNVEQRIAMLQTGCPSRLSVVHTEEGNKTKERSLHYRFRELRGNGEWFSFDQSIRDYISNGWKSQVAYWRDGLPVILGTICRPIFANGIDCHIRCECPKCGEALLHGYRPGVDSGSSSHRVSHCGCHHPGGYFIAANPNATHEIDPQAMLQPQEATT